MLNYTIPKLGGSAHKNCICLSEKTTNRYKYINNNFRQKQLNNP